MGALPPIRRLLVEDFSSQRSWITPLLVIFNSFTEAVVSVLNKGLTVRENTTGDILTLTLAGTLPVSVVWTKKLPPTCVLVGNVARTNGETVTITDAVGVTWSMSADGKSLQVDSVVGIAPTSSTRYFLTLLCFQG